MGFLSKSTFVVLIAVLVTWFTYDGGYKPDAIKGKRVLITGASQNIGEEIAYQYAELGANIVITARREKELKRVVEKCKSLGASDANYIVADMANLDQTKHVIDKAAKMMGGLDYLVLNHMIYLFRPGLWNGSKTNMEYLEKSTTINYLSYVHLSTHAIPHLSKSNGHLIVLSSLSGHVHTVFAAAYGPGKAAVNHFFSNLRMEMALQDKYDYSITICLLGPIDKKKSRGEKLVNEVKKDTGRYPMSNTAHEIIRAGATRSAYAFIPRWTVLSGIQRLFATDALDKIFLKTKQFMITNIFL